MSDLLVQDILDEEWREYEFDNRTYRIEGGIKLYTRPGGTTHRVLDINGIVHCVPSVGFHGCILRWKTKTGLPPVAF